MKKTPQDISIEIGEMIVEEQTLQWFREKCKDFATSYREDAEASKLRHFEVTGCFNAIKKFPRLRNLKTKPGKKMIAEFINFMKIFPTSFAKNHQGIEGTCIKTQEDMYKVYINPWEYLESLDPNNWKWEKHEITGEVGDCGRIKETVKGWGPTFRTKEITEDEDPWPYYLHKKYRKEYGSRPLEGPRDLSAMYVLLALCYEDFDGEPLIINNDIEKICPDIRELINSDFNNAEVVVDLNKALKYVETDLETMTTPGKIASDKEKPKALHSQDFRSVNWYGTKYYFTSYQAACVKVLWEAWENGTPEVGSDTILMNAECESNRLIDVFKDHPAWAKMIQKGSTKGTYRLVEPES